jgi:hypothetical protein
MLQQHSARNADHKFAAATALETSVARINDPQEGARLIRAFLRITDPEIRLAIVQMVEKLGSAPTD